MGNFDRSRIYTIFKMDVTIWLSVLLAVITLGTPASSSEPRVVCYYTNWSVYRPGTARFNPQNINPYLCTHLIYAFGGFTKDNTLKPFDKYQDIEKGGYAKFTGLKTYNKNLKTLLAIGGWNEGSTRFSPMVASRERRKEFVRNAIKFLRQNRFDGLDLDWEYPAFRDGGKPKDRENYAKLVRELREEFDRESEKTGKPRLLLTMAVPAGIEYIQKGFDVKTLNQYLDWLNLLTYDYHSAFEPAVNHHAPLYPLEEPNEYSVDNELNIDYTIKFYLENGADANKLVLGIPTYGRSYTLFNADAVEIGSPADGPGDQGDATREKGYLAYYEICEALKPKEKKRRQTSDEDSDEYEEEEEEPWSVMHPNPDAMGPVAYKGNQWVGYDDMDIVKKKAEYVAENGLGGIMFWSIDNDDFRGSCHGKPYPLIEAAKEAYFQRLGTTDNAVAVKKPTAVTRAPGRRKSKPRSTTTTTTTTPKPTTKANKRTTSTTPSWNITPEPPTTPDPGSDFKCVDEGFYPHPRDCKKYFWCLDSGPSNLGIVAHQFTCPSGLYFNKAADSCDFARNVLCKKSTPTTKAPTTKAPTTKTTSTTTTTTTTTTRRPIRLSTKSSSLFRTTSTTTTTPEPETEEEYEDETAEVSGDEDEAEDPRVIKELIDLIKKVGGIEQLEKQLFGDTSASTDGAITTTASPISKKLYQKVLERTRGKNKYTGNSIFSSAALNRGRGPQNEGIEPTNDRDKLLRRDRPQYTTINRQRSSSTTEAALESEEYEGEEEEEPVVAKAKSVETRPSVATTAKPLQYVNIRRGRPSTSGTSDTADDTASRNALFERTEPVSVSDTPNSLDVQSLRRENVPEYVTIRRQRPTTEETTTVQYEGVQEEVELQETALEREISTQPQYNTIVRSRSTLPPEEPSTEAPIIRVRSTTLPTETPSSPDPTTVLAVQISSLLNSASSSEIESPETEAPAPTTEPEPTTTTTTTTLRPALPPRRTNIIRRRGSTTTAAPTVPSSTVSQAVKRNFLRRTKATAPPETTETVTTDNIETTTNRFTRRGNSKFKSRKDLEKTVEKNEIENSSRRPALNGGARRNERVPPSRKFVSRRRIGGANATSTVAVPSSTATPVSSTPRRAFRIAARRRPGSSSTTAATTTTTTTQATTTAFEDEESLQDIGDTDAIEDPTLEARAPKTSSKIQRRPLILKDASDQNPSATNEDENKRQSKKFSASINQNQLDNLVKKSIEESSTEKKTTVEGYSGIQRGASRYRNEKLIPVPVEDGGYSTVGYSSSSQEPSYFTREYLLESPVTKTYDEEYQYLSPVTSPVTPTSAPRKVIRKKIHRKISTTLRPTTAAPTTTTTVKSRRVPVKPFEKVAKEPKKVYRPIASYDYYDDSEEKVAVKYVEGTKVVMHENGNIECLDIGNFPHPTSCKKFISCARIENGSLLGWEYICPKGLSFDPVGGICNWSAGLGCNEKDA
ncbi:chitinase 6 isoform X3 [Anticarsia gemmatalis]|uniref:chitinase 6 isoform X3 n=1 Tax=Anticarsia gemmatalis TaxID=129554 RepID=UPI003F7695FA